MGILDIFKPKKKVFKSKTPEEKIKSNKQYQWILKYAKLSDTEKTKKLSGKDERRRREIAAKFHELAKPTQAQLEDIKQFATMHEKLQQALIATDYQKGNEGNDLVKNMKLVSSSAGVPSKGDAKLKF